jgi:hypothetical protein
MLGVFLAKASLLKKFNYGRADFAEICYKSYNEKDFLIKYDETAASVVKGRKGTCVQLLRFEFLSVQRQATIFQCFPFLKIYFSEASLLKIST